MGLVRCCLYSARFGVGCFHLYAQVGAEGVCEAVKGYGVIWMLGMYDFLDIILSVVVFLSPHHVRAIQMWPYASDTNRMKRELTVTWRREGNRWLGESSVSLTIADGRLLDEHGKVLLDIKNHLKVSNGTNYVLTQKDWISPVTFSMVASNDERMISISDGTNIVRQIRVKMWKTDPPVEFADCDRRHTNDLAALRDRLLADNIHCTEIRGAPMARTFGFTLTRKISNMPEPLPSRLLARIPSR